jgi:hypothetical protein
MIALAKVRVSRPIDPLTVSDENDRLKDFRCQASLVVPLDVYSEDDLTVPADQRFQSPRAVVEQIT